MKHLFAILALLLPLLCALLCAPSCESLQDPRNQPAIRIAIRLAAYQAAKESPSKAQWIPPLEEALLGPNKEQGFEALIQLALEEKFPDEPGKRQVIFDTLRDLRLLIAGHARQSTSNAPLNEAAAQGFQQALREGK